MVFIAFVLIIMALIIVTVEVSGLITIIASNKKLGIKIIGVIALIIQIAYGIWIFANY